MTTKTIITTTFRVRDRYYYIYADFNEVLRHYCKQHTSKQHSNSKPVKAIKNVKCC